MGSVTNLQFRNPKITKSELAKMGLDVQNSDPRNFQLFGIQGAELSQMNYSSPAPQSPEIPIFIEGESDGKWDDGDYILFYGQSTRDWIFSAGEYKSFNNFYAANTTLIFGSDTKKANEFKINPDLWAPSQQHIRGMKSI